MNKQYTVTGMGCATCSGKVQKAIGALAGVASAQVDLEAATLHVELDPARVPDSLVKETIEEIGYGLAD